VDLALDRVLALTDCLYIGSAMRLASRQFGDGDDVHLILMMPAPNPPSDAIVLPRIKVPIEAIEAEFRIVQSLPDPRLIIAITDRTVQTVR
jgi:hypothetical protein